MVYRISLYDSKLYDKRQSDNVAVSAAISIQTDISFPTKGFESHHAGRNGDNGLFAKFCDNLPALPAGDNS